MDLKEFSFWGQCVLFVIFISYLIYFFDEKRQTDQLKKVAPDYQGYYDPLKKALLLNNQYVEHVIRVVKVDVGEGESREVVFDSKLISYENLKKDLLPHFTIQNLNWMTKRFFDKGIIETNNQILDKHYQIIAKSSKDLILKFFSQDLVYKLKPSLDKLKSFELTLGPGFFTLALRGPFISEDKIRAGIDTANTLLMFMEKYYKS